MPCGRSDGKERTHEREKYEPSECNVPSTPLLPTRVDDGIIWGLTEEATLIVGNLITSEDTQNMAMLFIYCICVTSLPPTARRI